MSVTPCWCFICRCPLEDESVVVIKKHGIQSLVAISVKRGLQKNAQFLEKLNEVSVHDACMKRYNNNNGFSLFNNYINYLFFSFLCQYSCTVQEQILLPYIL